MMKFLKSKKQTQKLFLFVTAMDQTVIARPNFKIKPECWQDLPEFRLLEDLEEQFLMNTPVFQHFQNLLEEKKYSFLYHNLLEKEQILERLGNISLPDIYFKELDWLKKFGYYYHHTLAITAFIAKFGVDAKLEDSFFQQALRAALIHDIGISRLPYNILFSHELFHEDDKLIMQQHTMIAYLLVGYYSGKNDYVLGQVALHHHSPEKFQQVDGSAPLHRVKSIVWMIYNMAIFDALISNRPFRPAYKTESALLYLKQLNRSMNMSIDIVNWLEQQHDPYKVELNNDFLVTYHPELRSHQLN